MKTINMGLNTSRYDKKHWEEKVAEVREAVEKEGHAAASWGCTGRTLHQILAYQLSEALPEYDFDIEYSSYKCEIHKRG